MYGGTKEEMQRLVKDAAKLDKSVDASSLSYGNIVKAIHAVQVEMGIYGTTSKEAEKTITGSLNAMKSAWGNLLPALIQGGDSFDQCVKNLVSTVKIFAGNIMPALKTALSGVGSLIEELTPMIAKELPSLMESIIPPLINSAGAIMESLVSALPSFLPMLATGIVKVMIGLGKAIVKNASKLVSAAKEVAVSVIKALYEGIKGQPMGEDTFENLKSTIDKVFGSISKIVSGIIKFGGTLMTALAPVLSFIGKLVLNVFTWLGDNINWLLPLVATLTGAFLAYKAALVIVNTYTKLVTAGQKLMGLISGTASKKVASSTATVGKSAATSAPQILAFAAAILAVGASILMISFGFALLVQSSIALANAGWGAIAVMVGMVAVIALLAVGAAYLGAALTAGTIGFLAFGGAVALVGLGFTLIGVGALLAANALTIVVSVLPQLVTYGLQGSIAIAALGLGLYVFAAGAALAGIAALALGAGLAVIAASLAVAAISFAVIAVSIMLLSACASVAAVSTLVLVKAFAMAVPPMLLFTASLLPLSAAMLVVTPAAVLFTATMTALMAVFVLLAPMAMLFAASMAILKPAFSSISKSAPKASKALKSLPKQFTKLVIPAGLLVAALAPLAVEFGLLAVSSAALLLTFTGIVTTSMLLSMLFTMIATVGKMLVPVFNAIVKATGSLVKAMKPLNDTMQDMTIPVTVVSVSFGSFSKSLIVAVGAAMVLNGALAQMLNMFERIALAPNLISVSLNNMVIKGTSTVRMFVKVLGTTLKAAQMIVRQIAKNISDIVDESISDIVDKISELPKKMGDGLKSSGKSLSASLVDVWKQAVKASVSPVNKVLEAANWILKEFGSKKRVLTWTPYAKGTDGHKGGNALVNDGRGAELVQMPNGNAFIPKGRNVFIPNAPKGMKVLPADRTAQLMGKKSPTYKYADGIGDIDIWSFIDNTKGLVNKISDSVSYEGMSGFALSLGKGMVTTFTGEMTSWIEKLFEEEGALSLANYVASKGVSQWKSTVIRALKMEGQYSSANVARTLHQMQTESGGNPKAINLWDSNAKKGIPSKGLMQVIDPTFNAYARKGFDKNIYDPLSNILASIRYAVSRYGSLSKAYRGVGYANGGFASKPSIFGEDGLEAAIPLSRDKRQRGISLWAKTGEMLGLSTHTPEQDSGNYTSNTVESTTYAPHFELTISGTNDDRAMARKVKRWIAEAMEDMFDTYDSKVPQTQEI